MASDDTTAAAAAAAAAAPFRRIPWTSRLLNQRNIATYIPPSRQPKSSTEDSLCAETLHSPRTIQSCIAIYQRPAREEAAITEVTTLYKFGSGLNGHAGILHGGITATMIDESLGMLQTLNLDRAHLRSVDSGTTTTARADRELSAKGLSTFTAFLTVQYLKPVMTPGAVAVFARSVKKEGRKENLVAEVRQCHDGGGDGEMVVCATGEALFVIPKAKL